MRHPVSLGQSRGRRSRAGFTLLEAQVSFVLLGIGLAGVGPLVVFQLKLSHKIQVGVNPQTANFGSNSATRMPATLVCSDDPWMRKLGVPATIATDEGPPPTGTALPPAFDVSILSVSRTGESVTVLVSAASHPSATGAGP